MFRGRAVLPRNEPKIVGFQDEHKGIPCPRMLIRPSHGGSLCHKHFFANFWTSCSWLPWRLCRRTRFIVCTGLYCILSELHFHRSINLFCMGNLLYLVGNQTFHHFDQKWDTVVSQRHLTVLYCTHSKVGMKNYFVQKTGKIVLGGEKICRWKKF